VAGGAKFLHPTRFSPRHVTREGWPEVKHSIQVLEQELDDLVCYAFPDALWVSSARLANDTYRVWVLDLDYSYTEWLASLSLDYRWTLSPRASR
jgi:hypothetical protein